MPWFTEAVSFAREVANDFSEHDCPTMAAALAYYTVFSLAPLLVIVIVVAGLVLSPEQAREAVHGEVRGLIGAEGAEQIATMVEAVQANHDGSLVARALGTGFVLFGATGVMIQLQSALNRAWNVQPADGAGFRRFFVKRLLSFAMILGIAFLLLVSLVLTAVLSALASTASALLPAGLSALALQSVNLVVSVVVITLLFAAIYKVMPEAVIRWRDVAVGAFVTALLFTAGKSLIGVYLGNSDIGSAYGAASSLAIVVVWVYYSAVIVLLGAEFTQVWTRRYGGGLIPEPGAVVIGARMPGVQR
jgi:membrane protein